MSIMKSMIMIIPTMTPNTMAIISPVVRPLLPPPLVGAAVVGENDSVGAGVAVGDSIVGASDGVEVVGVVGVVGEEVVGCRTGDDDVGRKVGDDVGCCVGCDVGEEVGNNVGEVVGCSVGDGVGCGVGATVSAKMMMTQQFSVPLTAALHTLPGVGGKVLQPEHVFVVFSGTQLKISIAMTRHSVNIVSLNGNG